jgi:crossover junction endodeoxyribonuclease RusA
LAGIAKPILGRVQIDVQLFPHRPQDWQKRQRVQGAMWDDSVQCIDLDNANKVLLDAIKDIAIEDDKFVRVLRSERMEPDEQGKRVVVTITALATEQPQVSMFEEAEA